MEKIKVLENYNFNPKVNGVFKLKLYNFINYRENYINLGLAFTLCFM